MDRNPDAMELWRQERPLVIPCPRGAAPGLAAEVAALGFPVRAETDAAVETAGTFDDTLKLNLHLRTAQRVLFLLQAFRATTPGELYGRLLDLPWEAILPDNGYVSVTSAVDHPTIRDSQFANVKCKDAIVDRIQKVRGRRPDSGPERTRSVVHLYWRGKDARIYLDTSGEPLSRRGYRLIPLDAPLQETLAAALVRATAWNGTDPFVNPMCGSGTLAVEAALIARRIAPGLGRSNFGFMHVRGYRAAAWQALRETARQAVLAQPAGRIVATDIRPEAVEAARRNARAAGVDRSITFTVCPFEHTPIPPGRGTLILNPPYGERMGELAALGETYRAIGDFLKHRAPGCQGFVFTGNPSLAKQVGLRTRQRLVFYNGGIECRLLHYDLYAGSRKVREGSAVPNADGEESRTQRPLERARPAPAPSVGRGPAPKTRWIETHAKKRNPRR